MNQKFVGTQMKVVAFSSRLGDNDILPRPLDLTLAENISKNTPFNSDWLIPIVTASMRIESFVRFTSLPNAYYYLTSAEHAQ